ncbi:MAG: hypothetical protein ABI787_03230 [Spartobacteria bacterium]
MKQTTNHESIITSRAKPQTNAARKRSFTLIAVLGLALLFVGIPAVTSVGAQPLNAPQATPSPSPSPSASPSPSPSASPSPSPSPSASPSPSPSPSGTPTSQPINISTRVRVENGQGVVIGGFIITGTASKTVLIRGIGPSLSAFGLTDVIDDPTLQLFGSGGQIAFNDNWRDLQRDAIETTQLEPTDDREPAIIATLSPALYTAAVSGKNGQTGIGLLEIYDLNAPAGSRLANISTRGTVLTEENVMIGGFILGGSNIQPAKIVVRAIGPSLGQSGINTPLGNPTLELFNSSGTSVGFNDDWQDDRTQAAELTAMSIAPTIATESAIVTTLPPGPYTAVVAGQSGTTGVGLIEVYDVQP